MVRGYYVDVSRTSNGGKRRSKLHVAYDGEKMVRVKRLTDLKECDEIYIDSLFPEIYDDLFMLLKKDVKVYVLRNPRLIKDFRDRLGLKKSDENDATVLSKISGDEFRALTLKEVEVRRKLEPLLEQFEDVSGKLKTVRIWRSQGWKLNGMDDLEKELARIYDRLKRRIVKIAEDELEMYRLVKEELGIGGVSMVNLLLHVDFSKGIRKIKTYIRHRGRARENLAKLAMIIYFNGRKGINNKYADIATKTANQKTALRRIQSEILKDLRRLYLKHFVEGT